MSNGVNLLHVLVVAVALTSRVAADLFEPQPQQRSVARRLADFLRTNPNFNNNPSATSSGTCRLLPETHERVATSIDDDLAPSELFDDVMYTGRSKPQWASDDESQQQQLSVSRPFSRRERSTSHRYDDYRRTIKARSAADKADGLRDVLRNRFIPWGGKRAAAASHVVDALDSPKRSGFQPWGGKRVTGSGGGFTSGGELFSAARSISDPQTAAGVDEYKRNFHPWGGKRSATK
jgi:hypothetical protein